MYLKCKVVLWTATMVFAIIVPFEVDCNQKYEENDESLAFFYGAGYAPRCGFGCCRRNHGGNIGCVWIRKG